MKNKKPAIRFKGFSEEWEEKELGDGALKIGDGLHGTPQYVNDGGVYFINGNNLISGIISVNNETKQVSVIEQSKNDKILNTNTILMSINGTIGNLAWYQGEKVMLGKSVAYITLEDFDKTFIYAYLQTSFIHNHFMNKLTGSTIKNLGLKTIRETEVLIPSNKTEQTQIGNFFKNLDNLITLHQRKYEKLGILKKAMLEKMFPKNGLDVPEIRFKGFSGAWEERKLGEITDLLDGDRGKNYPNANELQSIGHTLFLSATNVTTNGFKFDNNQYISEEKSNIMGNGKLIVNDIILTSRGSIGHIAWYNETIQQQIPFVRINSGMLILRSKEIVLPSFISQFLKSPLGKKQIDLISFGSAQPQLTKKDTSNYMVIFPYDIKEQEKIGNYFKNLDNLLTLHHGELDKLKNLKKALLEKMFV